MVLQAVQLHQRPVARFGEEDKKAGTLSQLNEIDHKMAMTGEVSKRTLDTIAKIMTT